MDSALGTIIAVAMEQWLFPLWLRPEEQAREVRELDTQLSLQPFDLSRLVADREPDQSLSDIHGLGLRKGSAMKDHYLADRRDPAVKQLEREGFEALLRTLHAQRIAEVATA